MNDQFDDCINRLKNGTQPLCPEMKIVGIETREIHSHLSCEIEHIDGDPSGINNVRLNLNIHAIEDGEPDDGITVDLTENTVLERMAFLFAHDTVPVEILVQKPT